MASDADVAAALNGDFPPESVRPVGMHLDRQRSLTVTWADGHESVFPLPYLRKHCPCATCRQTPADRPTHSGLSLTILPAGIDRAGIAAGASLVGNYAIQIAWADGHNTGIYDFRYLRAIDPSTAAPGAGV